MQREGLRVYSDGSDFQGGVGAAAVLYAPGRRRPRVLHYHLGPSTDHTVYEAEVVGTLLALELTLSLVEGLGCPRSWSWSSSS